MTIHRDIRDYHSRREIDRDDIGLRLADDETERLRQALGEGLDHERYQAHEDGGDPARPFTDYERHGPPGAEFHDPALYAGPYAGRGYFVSADDQVAGLGHGRKNGEVHRRGLFDRIGEAVASLFAKAAR